MNKHRRQSKRLPGYDYGRAGAYFITICTSGRECTLGNVVDGNMELSELGEMVEREWLRIAEIRENVKVDEFVVMPNHFHAIVVITGDCRGTARRAPTREQFGRPTSGSLPTIVRSFKSAVTKSINEARGSPGDLVWQRGYYEHVIRDEEDWYQTRLYIRNNPMKWELDKENPKNRDTARRVPTFVAGGEPPQRPENDSG